MDPFRYHDTNEEGKASAFQETLPHHALEPAMIHTRPGAFTFSNLVQSRIPSSPQAVIYPRSHSIQAVGNLARSLPNQWEYADCCSGNSGTEFSSSAASSPPNSIPEKAMSVSSSPPSSVMENGMMVPRRTFSRTSSVSSRSSCSNGNVSSKSCSLCRKNGERPRVYNSHTLHGFNNNGDWVVTCPILRSVRCQICGASGDHAHTISHCPESPNQVSVALMVKNTPRQGNGALRRRFCF